MVFEVSKEVDCIRIGVDKYSVRTGFKVRSIMVVSTQVIKEPRGFIRIIQCLMAILAFATTAGFSTYVEFKHKCEETGTSTNVNYTFGYPFNCHGKEINVPSCPHDNGNGDHFLEFSDAVPAYLPYDFSGSAEFFVATGVLSFLYTLIALVVYIFMHNEYANDPKLPVIDLSITAILTVFWLAGSSAWAQGVRDVKFYLVPDNVFMIIANCQKDHCESVIGGSFTSLHVSLVFGFGCFLLWASSLWFVYKETVFHTPVQPAPDPTQNQPYKGDGRV